MIQLTTERQTRVYVAFHAIKKLAPFNHTDFGMCTEIYYLDGTTQIVQESMCDVALLCRKLSCK